MRRFSNYDVCKAAEAIAKYQEAFGIDSFQAASVLALLFEVPKEFALDRITYYRLVPGFKPFSLEVDK